MKVNWFHLMPYRWLPDDFRERYHGVWVDLPNALYDPERGHTLYNEYLDMLEYADQMGFDAVGVNEHHQNGYGMMPSPNLMAAALARRTSNAMILVLGNSIALYNPPTRVAEEFAMLDVISGGRLVAGFPVGTAMDTNFGYGETPITLREKYREAHDLVMRALAPRAAVVGPPYEVAHAVEFGEEAAEVTRQRRRVAVGRGDPRRRRGLPTHI